MIRLWIQGMQFLSNLQELYTVCLNGDIWRSFEERVSAAYNGDKLLKKKADRSLYHLFCTNSYPPSPTFYTTAVGHSL